MYLNSKDVDIYIKNIKKQIPYKTKKLKLFLDDLKVSIEEYIESNQVSDISEIKEHFGNESEIAESFIGDTDIKTLKRKMSLKCLVVVLIIVIIAVWTIFLAATTIHSNNATATYEYYDGVEYESSLLNVKGDVVE